MSKLGQRILRDGMWKAGYMPQDIIDLRHAGKISRDEMNLVLYGTARPSIRIGKRTIVLDGLILARPDENTE